MFYAVSNWVYDMGEEPLEVTFKRLQRYGYDGIELIGEPEKFAPSLVRSLCEEYGLRVFSVLGWCIAPTDSRDLAHPDPSIRARSVTYVKQGVDLAKAVDAPIVVVIPAPAGRAAPVGVDDTEEAWQEAIATEWTHAVSSVQEVASYAEEQGVTLAVEPINRYETFLVRNVDEGLRFVREVGSPAVKLHLDAFHMHIEERDPAEAIRKAGDLLVNMHISDSNRETVGRGHIDFQAMMRALKEIGYQGALVLEPVPPDPNPFLAVRSKTHLPLRDQYAQEGIKVLRTLAQSVS
jgi:D-psicose/D-tagatose/L-ribulose 3-epimerase